MYTDDRNWIEKFQLRMDQAKRYVKFCTEIYEHQRKNGRFFLHEHPWMATSWKLECITKLENYEDVRKVKTHMCQFGMVSRIGGVGSETGPVSSLQGS